MLYNLVLCILFAVYHHRKLQPQELEAAPKSDVHMQSVSDQELPAWWLEEQQTRKGTLQHVCRKLAQSDYRTKNLVKNLLVDEKHKVLYCPIPKVACSSWKVKLVLMTGNVSLDSHQILDVHNKTWIESVGIRYLRDYSLNDIHHMLTTYRKFMFVREPLERLISAYRDKFTVVNSWATYFRRRYGRLIIQKFRKKATAREISEASDVRFDEFVRFLVDKTIPNRLNPHWAIYHTLCHPCAIEYDVIGHYETLSEDTEMILQLFFKDSQPFTESTAYFPKRNVKSVPSKDLVVKYYSNFTQETIRKLHAVYKLDFLMFGYKPTLL